VERNSKNTEEEKKKVNRIQRSKRRKLIEYRKGKEEM